MMLISLLNFSNIDDGDVLKAARAINRQLAEDFAPYWHWTARLRLDGNSTANRKSRSRTGKLEQMPDVRGDAIIYLWDRKADVADAIGYHDANNRGLPYGFIFTEIAKQLDEAWSVTLSHETMELVGDASANTLVAGPHPHHPEHKVFHWFEMCDAVQDQTYVVDDVAVSNFVLPSYFTPGEQVGARNAFLDRGLKSFGIAPGGYVGFYDPKTRKSGTIAADKRATERLKIKGDLGRRGQRERATKM